MGDFKISKDRTRVGVATRARTAFVLFLALLLSAEFVASRLSPYRLHPTASEAPRNPLPLRGWPEYLKRGPSTSDTNIAIVSNSQGVGLELTDPENLYTQILERALVDRGRHTNVENWSISGLRSDQIELLSMTAARREIDLLVVVTEIKSIDIAGSTRLGANADDLDLIAGNPAYWPMILNSPLLHDTDWDKLLQRFFVLNSAIVRLRPYALDRFATLLPLDLHNTVFGHRRSRLALNPAGPRQVTPASLITGDTSAGVNAGVAGVSAETWERQFRRYREPTFEKLFQSIHPRLRAAGTTLVWVWMPIYPGNVTSDLRIAARPVYGDLCAIMHEQKVRCVDLTESLPATSFFTASTSSHLNADGHLALSELLLPLIDDALH